MPSDLLREYISYLRDVSRKIVYRAGFENVLPPETRKRKNYYFNFDNYQDISNLFKSDEYSIPKREVEFSRYITTVNNFLLSEDEYKYFLGFGMIYGKRDNNYLFAPLVTAICNISNTDNGDLKINIDKQSYQVNYDLLAKLLNIKFEEEDGEERTLTQEEEDKFRTIEGVEDKVIKIGKSQNIPNSQDIFKELKENIPELLEVQCDVVDFNYESRFKEESLFGSLLFTSHVFGFVRRVPNVLSTYESLNDLLNQKPLNNRLLEVFLTNSIENQNEILPKTLNISEREISDAINNVPFSLSKRQKEGLKKAWQYPITYIEGPPGTGKSYTIQALIHSALILNKKILFVSHKKEALKVVKKQIDQLIDKEALLFITTTDKRTGATDKKETIRYLRNILNECDSLNDLILARKEKELEKIRSRLTDLKGQIYNVRKDIENDLDLTDKYFSLNEKFIRKRDYFTGTLRINLKNYYFRDKPYDKTKFEKVFNKLKAIYDSGLISPLKQMFKAKVVRYFISEFRAEKERLLTDINYFNDIFELNYFYSKAANLRIRINTKRLEDNRKRLDNLEMEKKDLMKKEFQNTFRLNILKKLYKDQEAKNSVQGYIAALRRIAPEAIIENWNRVNFKLLTDIIPLWCAELRDLGIVFPMKNEIFDLVIVDEASQVNIAEIIPAFYRGKGFCIVGDDKQLHLNATGVGFSLSKSFDNLCWNKNKLNESLSLPEAKTRNLLVSEASVLRFINSDLRTHLIPQTRLDQHFRSLPPLAGFTSNKFYDDELKIMTENGDNRSIHCFKALKVNGNRDDKQKYVKAEITELIKQLKKIVLNDGYLSHPDLKQFNFSGNRPSIGILAILRNQINKINEMLEESGISDQEFEKFDIMVGTPEEFQGNEKDIIFFTLGLDENNRWGKGHYEDPHRFNVATSRAKCFTFLIYAGIPRNADLIKKYLNHFGVKINSDDLIDTEKIPDAPNSPSNWNFDRNKCESEFEHKVADYLEKYINLHSGIELFNQVSACGQKRLDFVLYNKITKITCAVEVDGIQHFIGSSSNYTEAHLERVEILKRAKWEIIHIKYQNWYSSGWLCDEGNKLFDEELSSLYRAFDDALGVKSN